MLTRNLFDIPESEKSALWNKFEHEDTSSVDRMMGSIATDIHYTKCAFDNSALVRYLGKPGAVPEEVELPNEYAGVLMVFRTFNQVSYALIMEATSNMHIYDTVKINFDFVFCHFWPVPFVCTRFCF